MRKKGKKIDDSIKEHEKINIKLIELIDNVLEEFDMLELVEDSIKDIFSCDLNCVTCSRVEQGKCMQSFKKANIYWLRKIVQDEWMIRDIVEKIDGMREALVEMMEKHKEYNKNNSVDSGKFKERKDKIKNKLKNNHGYFI